MPVLTLTVELFISPIPQNVDASISVGEEEHVVVVVPGNLIHLELELLLSLRPVSLGVNEGDYIIFVTNGDSLTVWTPTDVDVFS